MLRLNKNVWEALSLVYTRCLFHVSPALNFTTPRVILQGDFPEVFRVSYLRPQALILENPVDFYTETNLNDLEEVLQLGPYPSS